MNSSHISRRHLRHAVLLLFKGRGKLREPNLFVEGVQSHVNMLTMRYMLKALSKGS